MLPNNGKNRSFAARRSLAWERVIPVALTALVLMAAAYRGVARAQNAVAETAVAADEAGHAPASDAAAGVESSSSPDGAASAQPHPARIERTIDMAAAVPASVGVFVRIRNLRELDETLQKTQILQAISTARAESASSKPIQPRSVSQLIRSLMGMSEHIRLADIRDMEIGLASSSWGRLDDVVWYLHTSDPLAIIDRWFPPEDRLNDYYTPKMYFFTMADQTIVAVQDEVIVIGRSNMEGPLLGDTLELLSGHSAMPPLMLWPSYEQLRRDLPAETSANVYVHDPIDVLAAVGPRDDPALNDGAQLSWHDWPATKATMIGVHAAGEQSSFSIQSAMPAGQRGLPVSRRTLEKLRHLPQTTALAWGFRFDLEAWLQAQRAGGAANDVDFYTTVLESMVGEQRQRDGLLSGIGDDMLLVWGSGAPTAKPIPQLSLFVHCDDPRAVAADVKRIASSVLEVLSAPDAPGQGTSTPAISSRIYLGARITRVALQKAAAANLQIPLLRVLAEMELCFAPVDDWLILSTSPSHLQQILAARNGRMPALGRIGDVRTLCQDNRRSALVGVAQPYLASREINNWVAAHRMDKVHFLDPSLWGTARPKRTSQSRRWGIGMKARQRPGSVDVARVYTDSPAAGVLAPGDLIIGVDDSLIDLQRPNADLRSKLAHRDADKPPVLRVLRDGAILQLALAPPAPKPSLAPPLPPLEVLSELAGMCKSMRLATFSAEANRGDRYAARITLRMVPPKPAEHTPTGMPPDDARGVAAER